MRCKPSLVYEPDNLRIINCGTTNSIMLSQKENLKENEQTIISNMQSKIIYTHTINRTNIPHQIIPISLFS